MDFSRIALAATACVLAVTPASAQTLARKDLSAEAAITIASTAITDCKAKGWNVSVAVVGRSGELIAHVRGKIATYKAPRSVDFVDELPRSATGKLVKRKLLDAYR